MHLDPSRDLILKTLLRPAFVLRLVREIEEVAEGVEGVLLQADVGRDDDLRALEAEDAHCVEKGRDVRDVLPPQRGAYNVDATDESGDRGTEAHEPGRRLAEIHFEAGVNVEVVTGVKHREDLVSHLVVGFRDGGQLRRIPLAMGEVPGSGQVRLDGTERGLHSIVLVRGHRVGIDLVAHFRRQVQKADTRGDPQVVCGVVAPVSFSVYPTIQGAA